jgi:ABC-type lipoprotein release transport system permease subunit
MFIVTHGACGSELVGCYLPASRAMRVDLVAALRAASGPAHQ